MVCTHEGDMLLIDYEGKFLAYIADSPTGTAIHAILTANHGLVLAGENGYIWTYNSTTNND